MVDQYENDVDNLNEDDMNTISDVESSEDEQIDTGGENEFRIGIVGYDQDGLYDEAEVDDELASMIDEAISFAKLPSSTDIVVVGNLLDRGVTKIGYDLASDRGYTTVGIFPDSTLYESEIYPVDREFTVGTDTPDDALNAFVNYVDIIIRVGKSEDEFDTTDKVMRLAEMAGLPTMEVDL